MNPYREGLLAAKAFIDNPSDINRVNYEAAVEILEPQSGYWLFCEPYMVSGEYVGDCTVVIGEAKLLAALRKEDHNKDFTDSQLIDEFETIHWAVPCTEDGTPLDVNVRRD